MSTETTESQAPPPEPWWKKAPQGPPPKWASPTAARRLKLRQTSLPARLSARTESAAAEGRDLLPARSEGGLGGAPSTPQVELSRDQTRVE